MVIGLKHNKQEHPRLYLRNLPIDEVTKYKNIDIWLENNVGMCITNDISTKVEK